MKRTIIAGLVPLLSLAAALLVAAPGLAQSASGARSLSLSLEPAKSYVGLGEPVYVTARLRNDGASAVQVAVELNPAAGQLSVEITGGGGGGVRPFVPLALADVETPTANLPPGGELSSVFPVFFGGRGWSFRSPGSYGLTAVLEGLPGGALRSETVTIRVEEGDGAGRYLFETAAADQLETGKFLIWQHGDHLRRAHATLEEIIAKYPQSPLASYGELAIGLNLSKPFRDYGLGRVRPSRPDAALERLRRVDGEVLPEVLRIDRSLGLARSYAELDQPAEARQALEGARQDAAGKAALEEMIRREIEFDPRLQIEPR